MLSLLIMKQVQIYLNVLGAKLEPDGVVGPMTIAALEKYLPEKPQKGIVWVRCDERLTNTYDDFGVLFVGGRVTSVFPCSTTAGSHYVKNPITYAGITGTAIACRQKVVGSHTFHTNSNWKSLWLGAPYFQQTKSIKIYRDGNKDDVIDKNIVTEGLFGINLHRAGLGSFVDRWSAGCQVVPDKYWFNVVKYFKNGEVIDFILI
jgi:hypothetical protein